MTEHQNPGRDLLRAKIRAAVEGSDLSKQDISLKIGRSECYIREYLRGKAKKMGACELVALEQLLLLNPGELTHIASTSIMPEAIDEIAPKATSVASPPSQRVDEIHGMLNKCMKNIDDSKWVELFGKFIEFKQISPDPGSDEMIERIGEIVNRYADVGDILLSSNKNVRRMQMRFLISMPTILDMFEKKLFHEMRDLCILYDLRFL
jgi:hypothetical protein